jgi:hypothetical protein
MPKLCLIKTGAMHTYDTLSEALADLRQRGYIEDLNLKPFCVECKSRELYLHPADFTVDEFYRFEGASNPDDNSIVFAISSQDGRLKGTLVDAYGTYAEYLTEEMIHKLRMPEQ